jgi:hypothetical protein
VRRQHYRHRPRAASCSKRPSHNELGCKPFQQNDVELRSANQNHRTGAEQKREVLLIHPVTNLQHERRASDIREQSGLPSALTVISATNCRSRTTTR